MTTGTWNPTQTTYDLDIMLLKNIAASMSNEEFNIKTFFNAEMQQQHSPMMRLPKEQWFALKEKFSKDEIISLIQFFTLAEMHYSGWEGGEKSPVIWLAKVLRQTGHKIDQTLLQWIKLNSDNKFLPYGAL
jgi:hypothetical protein